MKTDSYKDALKYLYGLQKYGIKFGLNTTSNILNRLGNPHYGQNYIHIGGTNGKGSVSAMLESILTRAGFRVGLYTSPHLVRFTERFRINGKEIPADEVAGLVNDVRAVMDPEEPPTFFEVTTAMALLYFARENTDISIIEVGMGGRLDATNVINPVLTIITNISLEHQFFLGNTISKIAYEKAGIIKRGVDLITGARQKKVSDYFKSVCHEKGARFWKLGKDFRFRSKDGSFNYYGIRRKIKDISISLRGGFQVRNACLSLCAVELLEEKGFKIADESIFKGLSSVEWPGRIHVFQKGPYIILDGAHNPGAVRELSRVISKEFVYKRMILIIGVMEDKDIKEMLSGIVPVADHVIFTRPVYSRSAEPSHLLSASEGLFISHEVIGNIPDAIERAKEMAQSEDMILITGSLFTVGEALSHLDPVKYQPDDV